MKKLFSLILAAGLILSLAACGAVVDYDTPKSEELSAAYDFYTDSQRSLASGMAITPEQADEVFIVLVSCGMDSKVSNVTRKQGDDGHCTVNTVTSFTAYDVYYTDGIVDRVEKGGKELYPEMYNILLDCEVLQTQEPEQPPENSVTTPTEEAKPEKVYNYDALQNIFMEITKDTTTEELWALISENDLPVTLEEYNGGKVVFRVAYTEGAAAQKRADSGDYLEIAFDKIGENSMSNKNRIMTVEYANDSWVSALLYVYGTWFDFREDKESEYSGYYIIDHFAKEDGITIKYDNGNETTTDYFKHNSAEEVIQEMIDSVK